MITKIALISGFYRGAAQSAVARFALRWACAAREDERAAFGGHFDKLVSGEAGLIETEVVSAMTKHRGQK
jgi:hypothetical protein